MSSYDVIIVGTGFASTFFLEASLQHAHPTARVLVLERGRHDTHAWQLVNQKSSSYDMGLVFENRTPKKNWTTTIGFGGGSNCWWGCTPRMLPNDFKLRSLYGVGSDWPLGYDDLAEYYGLAEDRMAISGPEITAFPRQRPYPLPPHQLTNPDKILQKAYPDKTFALPTARPSVATGKRPACCASSTCHRCPIDSIFTIQNAMSGVYEDPRVTLKLNSSVRTVTTQAGQARGVSYLDAEGRLHEETADLVVLGANAICNAEILLRSGIQHGPVGKGLNEQIGVPIRVYLKGVHNFQGSTSLTAHSYHYYDGQHRAERAACLIQHSNVPNFRAEFGRWKEVLNLKMVYEDLRQEDNKVTLEPGSEKRPVVSFKGFSEYTRRAIARARPDVERFLAPLPVEDIYVGDPDSSEAHIVGTAVMGGDPATSVVDRHLVHHAFRNLLVLGSSAFPSTAPANPTLTISALSLWAAKGITGRGYASGGPA